ncbi:pyridoxine kinase [Roseiarcus fermentans]|uniref:pyridoxal kinase n=1 Tax=Roseiarcus fermentans TaxID=1473586 RepID=A0A366FB84_9HYPH|nr:pyridoxal kinase PdxY [Roseiarcus fermentans]RBP11922.1 pyridoxine kinase [Roseiarcus fermentans]
MRPILSIQSHVVYGHVGADAAAFPLQRLGREVWSLMSVQFSSHTGYPGWRGRAFDAEMIDDCVAGLQAIGALGPCAGLLTGYLGKAEIGEAALRALAAVRSASPGAAWCCDPVIGDVGRGRYVAPAVADFFRERALAHATIVTPNAFELEWLTGAPARTLGQAREAIAALRARGPEVVAVTSVALDDTPPDAIDVLAGDDGGVWRARTPRLPIAVNGAGDLFAALFFHHWLERGSTPEALAKAVSSTFCVVAATLAANRRELALIDAQEEFLRPSQAFSAEPLGPSVR